jgi:hypothetical protein
MLKESCRCHPTSASLPAMLPTSCRHRRHRRRHLRCQTLHPFLCLRRCRCHCHALPQPPRCCHRAAAVALCAATALPSPPRHRQAAADIPLSRCHHCRCHHRRASVRWLLVALFSAVRLRHHMPSCNRRRSCFRSLSPIIVFHCRLHRCRRASTAAAAGVELIVINCQRKRHKQHHQQLTNGSTNLFTFTFPVNLDLFNLSTVSFTFNVCNFDLCMSMF